MKNTGLILIGLSALGFLLWQRATGVNEISVQVHGFDFNKRQLQIRIVNPSSVSEAVKSVIAEVFINGKRAASVDTTQGFTLKGPSTQIVSMPVTLDILGSGSLLLDYFTGRAGAAPKSITVEGSVNVHDVVIPFQKVLL